MVDLSCSKPSTESTSPEVDFQRGQPFPRSTIPRANHNRTFRFWIARTHIAAHYPSLNRPIPNILSIIRHQMAMLNFRMYQSVVKSQCCENISQGPEHCWRKIEDSRRLQRPLAPSSPHRPLATSPCVVFSNCCSLTKSEPR